jgi:streptogramin lyase
MKNMKLRRLLSLGIVVATTFLLISIPPTPKQAAAAIQLPPGYELDILTTAEPGFWFGDLAIDPAGGLVVAVGAASRRPCDSYIGSISQEGVFSKYAEPCVDHPDYLDFNVEGKLFFAEGAGWYDDIYTVPYGGTAAETRLFVSGAIVSVRELEFGPDGNLYVADLWFGRIYRITPEREISTFASGFSTNSTARGAQLNFTFDTEGTMFVADEGKETIFKVSPEGIVTPFVSGFGKILGIEHMPDGNLFATERDTGAIYSISPDGTVSTWATGFIIPGIIKSDSDGTIYLTDADNGVRRIVKIARFVTSVNVDIKPGCDPNCFKSDGHGVIPVAIFSDSGFDATQVDPATISLDGQGVRIVGKGNTQAHVEDVDGDGLDDLVVQIEDTDETYEEGNAIAILSGETFDGTSFEGSDSICIVP